MNSWIARDVRRASATAMKGAVIGFWEVNTLHKIGGKVRPIDIPRQGLPMKLGICTRRDTRMPLSTDSISRADRISGSHLRRTKP